MSSFLYCFLGRFIVIALLTIVKVNIVLCLGDWFKILILLGIHKCEMCFFNYQYCVNEDKDNFTRSCRGKSNIVIAILENEEFGQ